LGFVFQRFHLDPPSRLRSHRPTPATWNLRCSVSPGSGYGSHLGGPLIPCLPSCTSSS
jgi:hypothetical protein